VGALVGKVLDEVKCATLESIRIMCPPDQVDVVKPGTEGLGTEYFTVAGTGGFANIRYPTAKDEPYSLCCIEPLFTVLDWERAEPLMKQFEQATSTEKGCIYYGWVKSGDKLICREAYIDVSCL
jgi:hypothetical protein